MVPQATSLGAIVDRLVALHATPLRYEDGEGLHKVLRLIRPFSAEVVSRADVMAHSAVAAERAMAADLLGEVCNGQPEYVERALPVLERLLSGESDAEVVCSVAEALGKLWSPGALAPLVSLADHGDDAVRRAVASGLHGALCNNEDPRGIDALIRLSADSDARVRDWATFALGDGVEADDALIREALLARVRDEDPDTRAEALVGLAKRHDVRVIDPLRDALTSEVVGTLEVRAALEIASPALAEALIGLRGWWDVDPELLDQAVRQSTG
jgi:HEAT repeat protein